jgi:hypothetical protein
MAFGHIGQAVGRFERENLEYIHTASLHLRPNGRLRLDKPPAHAF